MKNLRILLIFVSLIFLTNPLSANQMGYAAKESQEQASWSTAKTLGICGFVGLITVLIVGGCQSNKSKVSAGTAH
jgi:hypothetical protein